MKIGFANDHSAIDMKACTSGRRYEEKLRRKTRKNYLLNIVASGCYKNPESRDQAIRCIFGIWCGTNKRKGICILIIDKDMLNCQLV